MKLLQIVYGKYDCDCEIQHVYVAGRDVDSAVLYYVALQSHVTARYALHLVRQSVCLYVPGGLVTLNESQYLVYWLQRNRQLWRSHMTI